MSDMVLEPHFLISSRVNMQVAVGVRRRVLPFEAPGEERRALRCVRRAAQLTRASCRWLSVAVADPGAFQFVCFALSPQGFALDSQRAFDLMIAFAALSNPEIPSFPSFQGFWKHQADDFLQLTVSPSQASQESAANDAPALVVLVSFRPEPLLPLCWASARRAVRLVHGVVALVTANAYISTLGGGHFLCRHLDRSTLMAKLQMAVSVGLQDPILESKCRVNLAYNALQLGRFARARRIIEQEARVAERLGSDELRKVCHAAGVYLAKTYRLHLEFKQRNRAALLAHSEAGSSGAAGAGTHLHDNFYRQRIVRLK